MKKLILTVCLAATGVFGAAAQMRLTLGEALDLALSENPTVKVAEMEVQRFDYVKRQTWGSWIPQISVGGTYIFGFFALIALGSLIFAIKLPETKDKSLEQIQKELVK